MRFCGITARESEWLPISMALALTLSRGVKGEKFFRTVYFLPVVISCMVIGQLWMKIFNSEYGLLNGLIHALGWTDFKDFLGLIADNGVQEFHADFSEGYCTDHWTYNLDLIETYLEIFPDREEELLFLDKGYTFYESQAVVLPREERYKVSKDGVRQNAFLKDISRHPGQKGRLCTKTGEVYKKNLAVKLFTVAINKFATLDMQGLGIEMEAGKPGWYDALNCMPGIFGSSMCEAYELFRFISFLTIELRCYKRPVVMPEELGGFIEDITKSLLSYYEEGCDKERLWDEMNLAKEAYRRNTGEELSGREMEKEGVLLESAALAVREGLVKELDLYA